MDDLIQVIGDIFWERLKRKRDAARCPACRRDGTRELVRREDAFDQAERDAVPADTPLHGIVHSYWLHYRCRRCEHTWRTFHQDTAS